MQSIIWSHTNYIVSLKQIKLANKLEPIYDLIHIEKHIEA